MLITIYIMAIEGPGDVGQQLSIPFNDIQYFKGVLGLTVTCDTGLRADLLLTDLVIVIASGALGTAGALSVCTCTVY